MPKTTPESAELSSAPKKSTSAPSPELDALHAQLSELTSDLQRTRADFENFRKNTEKEKSQVRHLATFATVEKFLPLLDDFSRALTSYPRELQPLKKNYDKLLASLDLSLIPAAPGTPFNPELHEAVMTEGSGDKEEISETLRSGYYYEGTVLRPAMVKVRLS